MTADLTPTQAARLEAIEAAGVEIVVAALDHIGAFDRSNDETRDRTYIAHEIRRALAVAAIDVMRGATDDGAVGRDHCSTCECIHEPCGYVIGSAGCEDFHDRAAVGAPAAAEGDDRA